MCTQGTDFVGRIGLRLFEIVEHIFIGHRFVILAVDAFAVLPAHRPFLEALTVLLYAKRLSAGAPFPLFEAVALGWSSRPRRKGRLPVLMAPLVVAIHASAVPPALLAGCKALTIEFHTLRVPTVADFLLPLLRAILHWILFLNLNYLCHLPKAKS